MARSDYDHWNEDADMVWWLEEGRHAQYDEDDIDFDREAYDDYDDDDEWEDDEVETEVDYSGPEDLGWDGGLEA